MGLLSRPSPSRWGGEGEVLLRHLAVVLDAPQRRPDGSFRVADYPRPTNSGAGVRGLYLRTDINPNPLLDTMQITKQLAVFLENRPGMLARVCDALGEAKINIYAITTSDTVDHSVIRMVVSDPRKALLLFEEHGTLVVEDDVLMVDGDNKPGSLAQIAHRLAAAKINIEYCYSATSPEAKKGLLILRASDAKKALKVLNS